MANRIKISGTTANAFTIGLNGVTLDSSNASSAYTLVLPSTDGNANQVLSTNGSGNLNWVDVQAGTPNAIVNGNSNVTVDANSNVRVSVAGIANTVVFTSSNTVFNAGSGGNITGANLIQANFFSGNGSLLTGIVATNANYAAFSGNVTGNAQPNITSVGTLANLTVTGNVSANFYTGNGSLLTGITATNANYAAFSGNVTNNAQPNITSVGTLTGLTVNGNVTANVYKLNLTAAQTANAGEMTWNTSDGTMDLGMLNGVTQQVGQETYFYVKANAAITNGRVVMFDGAQGGTIKAKHANTASAGFKPSYVMGVATQDIALNADGYITAFGKVSDLLTNAFPQGSILWLEPNSDGNFTLTEPAAPGPKIQVAACLIQSNTPSATNGRIVVRPQIGLHMYDLHDVSSNNAVAGDVLVFNSSNVWATSNTVPSANTAVTVTANAQPNITSVGTLTSLAVSGNITAGNANVTGQLISTVSTGTAPLRVNSTTQVANLNAATAGSATTAGTVTANAQPNITSVGILSSLSVTGNTTSGNFIGVFANGNSNISIPVASGNINISAGGTPNELIVTNTGVNVAGYLTATGNVSANYYIGNGSLLTGISGGGTPNAIVNGTSNLAIPTTDGSIEGYVNGNLAFVVRDYQYVVYNGITNDSSFPFFQAEDAFKTTVYNSAEVRVEAGYEAYVGTYQGGDPTLGGGLNRLRTFSYTNDWTSSNIGRPVRISLVDPYDIGSLVPDWSFGVERTGETTYDTFFEFPDTTKQYTAFTGTANTVTANAQPNITSVGTLANLTVTGNVSANFYTGNGSLLTGISGGGTPNAIVNGNSNVTVDANSNVRVSIAGTANTVVFTSSNTVFNSGSGGNITGANLVSANFFSGNGSLLTGIVATNANYAAFSGNVTANSQPNITSVGTLTGLTVSGNANISNLQLNRFNELVAATANATGTLTPDMNNGSIHRYLVTGNITLNTLSNAVAGTSATLILTQDTTGNRLLTSNMKFAGNSKVLSTSANAVDIMSVFYDGNVYYASLTKGYV